MQPPFDPQQQSTPWPQPQQPVQPAPQAMPQQPASSVQWQQVASSVPSAPTASWQQPAVQPMQQAMPQQPAMSVPQQAPWQQPVQQSQQPAPQAAYVPPDAPQWTQVGAPAAPPPAQGQVPPPIEGVYSPPYMPPQEQYAAPPAQGQYEAPPTGFQRVRPGGRSHKGVYFFAAFVVLLCGVYVGIRLLSPNRAAYALVQAGTLSARYTGDALIVRDETVYVQDGVSRIDYSVEEGAQIARTDTVCTVYTSGFNTRELTTLQTYRDQIKDYHKSLISTATSDSRLSSLESAVLERAIETQELVQGGGGSLINQEALLKSAMQDRQIYLRQKYPDDQKLSRLYDNENTQLQRISSWTKQYAATFNGLVSFYTDGYESALNMDNYAALSPSQVRALYNGQLLPTEKSSRTVSIYRLVRQNAWAVLMLCDNLDWTPVKGRTYKLLIESFDSTVVDATVESFTRSGGELLVRLVIQSGADVENVLYLRDCEVQLGESVNSLTVPARALYNQNGRIGVVMDTVGGQYWTAVTVVSTEGTVAHIIPENTAVLYEGVRVLLF